MGEKDIVIRMRQLWCCKGAEFARPELQDGWEEIERLREALRAIANGGCGLAVIKGSETRSCPDLYEPDDWCWCCIARRALDGGEDE